MTTSPTGAEGGASLSRYCPPSFCIQITTPAQAAAGKVREAALLVRGGLPSDTADPSAHEDAHTSGGVNRQLPTVHRLHQLLHYDPETGDLRWRFRDASTFQDGGLSAEQKARMWNVKHAGKLALASRGFGYGGGTVDRIRVSAHRVAWAMHYGAWPDGVIDHINRVRSDNRISNLRCVTQQENLRNQGPRKNKSGVTGVFWQAKKKRWVARIKVDRKDIWIGNFKTIEEAALARKAAEKKYGFFSVQCHGQLHSENTL